MRKKREALANLLEIRNQLRLCNSISSENDQRIHDMWREGFHGYMNNSEHGEAVAMIKSLFLLGVPNIGDIKLTKSLIYELEILYEDIKVIGRVSS